MRKDSVILHQQTQQCLTLLALLHHTGQEWVSTREVADKLDISVYRARLRLLELQEKGRVDSNRESGIKGKALYWKRINA
ncbi:hypothetical protein F3J29_12835 [Enterobacter sp. Cy-643]|uniref:FaeA/PapI family transcriptional regulator n=1 Tax=Enterobacter sp. Cy-643 TaxID=2608346 RepID=UPI00141D8080|nr:hypothetical protein [Enterobacter sp. Cy-643]